MLLFDATGNLFASGAFPYLDHHPNDEVKTARIVVKVGIGFIETEAVVDTGGVFFICDSEMLALSDCELGAALQKHRVNTRGYSFYGNLHRVSIALIAQRGESIPLEVTVFVPDDPWPFPAFLGLQGCLEFIRFAVDPGANMFYFGALA